MAEGYVLTSAQDVNDLVAQIATQAASRGWTLHRSEGLGNFGRTASVSKDGCFVHLGASLGASAVIDIIPAPDRIPGQSYQWAASIPSSSGGGTFYPDIVGINVSTGYNGSLPWNRQPGAHTNSPEQPNTPRFRTIRAKGAIGRVHMFFYENPAALFIVCESRAGEYYWMGGGNMLKNRDWAGGQFYGASLPDTNPGTANPSAMAGSHARCAEALAVTSFGNGWGGYFSSPDRAVGINSDPSAGTWLPQYITRNVSSGYSNDDHVPAVQRGYDPSTGRLWIQPARTFYSRQGGGSAYIGTVPHVHFSTTSHFVGGEVVNIGGVRYIIFPWNWRQNPYDWDVTTTGTRNPAEPSFTRNNTKGSGWALRLPD